MAFAWTDKENRMPHSDLTARPDLSAHVLACWRVMKDILVISMFDSAEMYM